MAEPLARPSEAPTRELAIQITQFLHDKKAEQIVVYDVEKLIQLTSYFILASATSTRALLSLAEGLERFLKDTSLKKLGIEGTREGRWVCLDYGDIVIHLFDPDARQFYDLDHLWGDAPKLDVPGV